MGPSIIVTFTVLLCSQLLVHGGKVLVFPMDGSHWVNMNILIEELYARGHTITVIQPSVKWYIKAESPHYSTINIPFKAEFNWDAFNSLLNGHLPLLRGSDSSIWSRFSLEVLLFKSVYLLHKDVIRMMEKVFEDEEMMQSLRDAKYDMVLTDPATGGGTLLAHRLRLPLVFNVRWTVQGEGHQAIAPSPLSYVPSSGAELTDKMTFCERVKNMCFYFVSYAYCVFLADPNYAPFVHRYFGPDVHYMELFQDADIWLMRNDFTFEFPRPTMPNIVYMGGFQCKPSKPLPQDLEAFVQSSGEHGLIIMSLGTVIGQLPESIAEVIATAFAQLPQKVIWRHTGKRPVTMGNNTLLLDWLPQNDLLGHPKTRVFVAHGGTNGLQEAIYHGVPILGIPLIFDQIDNLSRMRVKGVAKILDIATLNKDSFLDALKVVMYESSYREKMWRLSRLHRDQPMKPLDRAMFWIEYVMRNKGAAHLRTQSFRMSWIQYHCVDVISTLLAAILLMMLLCISTLRFLWHKVLCWGKVKRE